MRCGKSPRATLRGGAFRRLRRPVRPGPRRSRTGRAGRRRRTPARCEASVVQWVRRTSICFLLVGRGGRPHVICCGSAEIETPAGCQSDSLNMIDGFFPPVVLHLFRPRLFVSRVKPSVSQTGAVVEPSFTWTLILIVVPALKSACEPPPSPKILYSAVFQPCARSTTE